MVLPGLWALLFLPAPQSSRLPTLTGSDHELVQGEGVLGTCPKHGFPDAPSSDSLMGLDTYWTTQ